MSLTLLLTSAMAVATPTLPSIDGQGAGSGIRFNDGKVAEIYSEKRASAPEDQRQWLTVRLGEVGLVVVSDDGKSEIVSIDKFGGVYVSGDLYVKGKKIEGQAPPSAVKAVVQTDSGYGLGTLLLACLLTLVTSIIISANISSRQRR